MTLVYANGRPWTHAADVSERMKAFFGEAPCRHCAAPGYAHQVNVLEYLTACDLYEPTTKEGD